MQRDAAQRIAPAAGNTASRRDAAVQRTQNWRNRRAAERVIRRAEREDARTARNTPQNATSPAANAARSTANIRTRRDLAVQETQGWRNRRAAQRAIARAERADARDTQRAIRAGGRATAFGMLPPARGAARLNNNAPRLNNNAELRRRMTTGAAVAGAIGAAFAARQAVHGHWYRDWKRRRLASGWFGPVYWPYAYDTIFVDVFWPTYAPYYVDYDPFWDYGYSDIYAGIFSPYVYEDVLIPLGPQASGRRRVASAPSRSTSDTGNSVLRDVAPACGDDEKDLAGIPVDDIAAAVEPNDAQRAALDELGNASVTAAQTVKSACPTSIALTPVGRLDAMQQRVEGMINAVTTVREPMEKFYALLNDEQKARFNVLGERQERQANPRSIARNCASASQATEWPAAQIERAVKPTPAQRESLDAVRQATQRAADTLKASCPNDQPATPTARLGAIQARLEAMREAIVTVKAPLAAFYDALSDEQKAQFNAIGRSARAARN